MSKVFLGNVAKERKETCKGSKNGYPIVGLEHLTPEEITLSAWEEDKVNSFKKLFHGGDVLFGRRRAYLKKAVVAPFKGICSGDITVIEAIPEKILPELLPFVIQNDALFDFAVGKSAGSLSPRVKWEHLKNYEFELPDMEKQRELAKVLWAMDATKKSYQKLLLKTDELVKSQFVELFGDPKSNPMNWKSAPLTDAVLLLRNGANIKQGVIPGGYPITRIETIADRTVDRNRMGYAGITDLSTYESYILQNNDILMSHINSIKHMGKSAIYQALPDEQIIHGMNLLCLRPNPDLVEPLYLYRYFQLDYFYEQVLSITKPAVNQASMRTSDLGALKIIYPPIELQRQYCQFVRQSDKSKFQLEQALAELTATYKKIISENLG
ncbi:restriction endonuclease subunit S [Bacillus paramycoides]|uniref:restriction endonuclease subunit S n=1 Tax=Bacillus paramycoides TaxID=2026194 RepID=UPI003D015CE8